MTIPIFGTAAAVNESKTRGWVVGHFANDHARTTDLEIKLWHYNQNPNYQQKQFDGPEFIIVEGGIIRIDIVDKDQDSKTYILPGDRRDYIILPTGTNKHISVEEMPAFGVTVRWPSHSHR